MLTKSFVTTPLQIRHQIEILKDKNDIGKAKPAEKRGRKATGLMLQDSRATQTVTLHQY
jgi:hypothetical protein